jgi:hypothetical protein
VRAWRSMRRQCSSGPLTSRTVSVTSKRAGQSVRTRIWPAVGGVATLAVAVVVVVLAAGGGTSRKPAPLPALHPNRAGPQSMFTAGSVGLYTPPMLDQLRLLGIDSIHVYLHWADIAPDITARAKPRFNANDPAAYPAAGWVPFDQVIRAAAERKIGLDLDLVAPPPRWASAPGAPSPATQPFWKPNAAMFRQFVHAVGVRYSGHYTPAGSSRPLPRVHFWSIWNEPNLGIEMAPEAVDHSTIEVSPRYYRAFVDAAWSAFHATGHGRDTILIGELAPAGVVHGAGPGDFNAMPPLRYLRALYCVDANYRPLRGVAASIRGCPATAAGSARFAARHPGLFRASGLADHPYPQGLPPNVPTPDEPDFAELAELPKLERTLDTLQRVYGSSTAFPIWSTEFGYQTTPPDPEAGTVSPQKAAYYLNWSEYMTWSDPRIKSYNQYLWSDSPNAHFATGLFFVNGTPKPGFYAFRMPLYLPVSSTQKGHPLVVWGGAREAPGVARRTHRRQIVQIQFRPGSSGSFTTIARVPITNPHGYFEVRETFPGSGQVRLAWSLSRSQQALSRIADVTLR